MPRKPVIEPDALLGRMLRLAEKQIKAMEARARAFRRLTRVDPVTGKAGVPSEEQIAEARADRELLLKLGEFVRKTAADLEPPDLSKMTDEQIDRILKRLGRGDG